jgi:hypothetical protein
MPTRIKLADVNATTLADAECIVAVDPDVPAYYTQVWTLSAPAEGVIPNTVEVEINSDDAEQLPQLKELVEQIKGPMIESMFKFE